MVSSEDPLSISDQGLSTLCVCVSYSWSRKFLQCEWWSLFECWDNDLMLFLFCCRCGQYMGLYFVVKKKTSNLKVKTKELQRICAYYLLRFLKDHFITFIINQLVSQSEVVNHGPWAKYIS